MKMKNYLDYNLMTLTLMQSHRGLAKYRIFLDFLGFSLGLSAVMSLSQ